MLAALLACVKQIGGRDDDASCEMEAVRDRDSPAFSNVLDDLLRRQLLTIR